MELKDCVCTSKVELQEKAHTCACSILLCTNISASREKNKFYDDLQRDLVVERWIKKVKDVGGVGILLNCKLDGRLFRQYTRNAT